MTECTRFKERINRPEVATYAMGKRAGHDIGFYWRLWRLLRSLQPNIVHTRNIGTLECALIARLAGVKLLVHGEHGRDSLDLHGTNIKYIWLRRFMQSIVKQFITVSKDLRSWLVDSVNIPADKVAQIYNGVDENRFSPARAGRMRDTLRAEQGWQGCFVLGTVGQMRAEKDTLNLVRAFIILIEQHPHLRDDARLVLVGDGPLRLEVEQLLAQHNLQSLCWLCGEIDDIPAVLGMLDLFVLPSKAEGIANTILEAMASGLPILATDVGGNGELVQVGNTGMLVPAEDAQALADGMCFYIEHQDQAKLHGQHGRARIEAEFSLAKMVQRYQSVYDQLLGRT